MAVLVAVVVCVSVSVVRVRVRVRVRECRRWMDVSEDRERDVGECVC